MGLNLFGNSCGDSFRYNDAINPETNRPNLYPNPNPSIFRIVAIHRYQFNGKFYVIARINYPNCTNYEGNKILVWENRTIADIMRMEKVDPHFTSNPNSPIARFEPTDRGWKMAESFIRNW